MPQVSVVLPAYYSHATLRDCLMALRRQTYRDFEVIVVNSSQEEETAAVMTAFPEVTFIQAPHRLYPHAARNRGFKEATGDLLVCSDPDCTADPDWLSYLVKTWQQGFEVVGGTMALASTRWLEQGIHLCKFHFVLDGQSPGDRWILPSANVAYSRAVWNHIGPFESDVFAGDALQCWQAHEAGYRVYLEPRARVAHRHEDTFISFCLQRLRRGKEFGVEQVRFERWTSGKRLLRMVGTPLRVARVLMRAGRDAWTCGWFLRFFSTLPVQFVGHAAWAWGEALAYATTLARPLAVRRVQTQSPHSQLSTP